MFPVTVLHRNEDPTKIVRMNVNIRQHIEDSLSDFRLPRYRELPDVGLYLEQVVHYVNAALAPLGVPDLTASMVGNYVKQGLIPNPVKKRYYAEQVAYLMFVTTAKNVLTIENLRLFISMQQKTYDVPTAWDYLCDQMEIALGYAFGRIDALEDTGVTDSEEKAMLRYCVIAMTNVVYLNKCFDGVRDEGDTAALAASE